VSGPRKRIGCVIVAHGRVGHCLMEAVEGILGKQTGWVAVSNAGMRLKELTEAVDRAVASLSKDYDVVVISDMPGGSCHHVCQELLTKGVGMRALTGVNLMMLLEFFVKRERTEINELVSMVKERGRDAVRII
jgi:PTS system mannose-specific IIA component